MKALTTGHRGLPTLLFNAVTRRDVSHGALVQDVPVPKLENNEMLVRVHYVALNPSELSDFPAVISDVVKGFIPATDYEDLI